MQEFFSDVFPEGIEGFVKIANLKQNKYYFFEASKIRDLEYWRNEICGNKYKLFGERNLYISMNGFISPKSARVSNLLYINVYMNNLYVTTPIGADIFKVAGGGQNYVHGGSSLQEMLIPVIELTTNTRAVAYDYVDVILTSVNRKVTNLITYFDFIQTEKVTDTMKARSLVAYFTTEDGEKISFDVPIVANSREDAPEMRTFHEKFTLKSREYKYGDKYYLVLADANDEKNILQQYEFMIDIAFVDDFGF